MSELVLGAGPGQMAELASAESLEARARALVLAQFDFVWRLLRRLGVPESDAEDATQQVLLVAVQRLDQIPHDKERTFLYGTALYVGKTLRRNLRRRSRWLEVMTADAVSENRGPLEDLERREALAALDRLLNELPDELREVFVLCEIEELTGAEVATLLALPAGTVASRLRRAREAFRKRLLRLQAKEGRR